MCTGPPTGTQPHLSLGAPTRMPHASAIWKMSVHSACGTRNRDWLSALGPFWALLLSAITSSQADPEAFSPESPFRLAFRASCFGRGSLRNTMHGNEFFDVVFIPIHRSPLLYLRMLDRLRAPLKFSTPKPYGFSELRPLLPLVVWGVL